LTIFTIIQLLPVPVSRDCGKVCTPSFLLTLMSAYTTYVIVVIKVTQVCKTECLTTSLFYVSSESLYKTDSTFPYKSKESQVIRFFSFLLLPLLAI